MAYSDFTLEKIKHEFGIENQIKSIFTQKIEAIAISETLKESLAFANDIPKRSEKAKSEFVVLPILIELLKKNKDFLTIHSGENLNADKKQGLVGECDYILTKNTHSLSLNLPIISILEAKKDDIEIGIAQCAAQLYGARIFNQKDKIELPFLYGCVTNSKEWQFIRLTDSVIEIHNQTYFLPDIENILGIFQFIVDSYKKIISQKD